MSFNRNPDASDDTNRSTTHDRAAVDRAHGLMATHSIAQLEAMHVTAMASYRSAPLASAFWFAARQEALEVGAALSAAKAKAMRAATPVALRGENDTRVSW